MGRDGLTLVYAYKQGQREQTGKSGWKLVDCLGRAGGTASEPGRATGHRKTGRFARTLTDQAHRLGDWEMEI